MENQHLKKQLLVISGIRAKQYDVLIRVLEELLEIKKILARSIYWIKDIKEMSFFHKFLHGQDNP